MFMNNRKCGCEMPNVCGPIMEAPIEKCIQKDIVHEVEQGCFFMIYIKKLRRFCMNLLIFFIYL